MPICMVLPLKRGLKSNMTTKDYILIASVIREFFITEMHSSGMRRNLKANQKLVKLFCESLSNENPQFKPETFRRYIVKGK